MTEKRLKIVHTADWHLGHHLHGYDRSAEHQAFLDWLQATLLREQADVLLVAGDLFDSANPPASAWQMLYRFLAHITRQMPHLNVVMIGGNHDSPSKLDAPHELLRAFNLHLIGAISRDQHGELETERLQIPLLDAEGQVCGTVLAVPFLRSADLRGTEDTEDRLLSGVRAVYRSAVAAAETQRGLAPIPLIGMGHAYMAAGQLSEMSERRVLGGNQHALPADIFPPALSYVALGHLHMAQRVAGTEHIRYSGSPLPLSLAEHNYRHQVLLCEFAGATLLQITPLYVPRYCDMLRLPGKPLPLSEVLSQLEQLHTEPLPRAQQPFLEVQVLLDKPIAMLREKIAAVLTGKAVRLAKISVTYPPKTQGILPRQTLAELKPEEAFRLCYQRRFAGDPEPALQQAFNELLAHTEELEQGEERAKS
ncbi:exonuclease SbcCD subunit D C-terminal domain-containing protein [Plesiomonas sp.]|uniref:exonuclease SbcCD subunit D C-terminal domain-containing protein n=1 Tax=Plesiomonas sp. TaxID=2486279 RepID=UPI003F3A3D29